MPRYHFHLHRRAKLAALEPIRSLHGIQRPQTAVKEQLKTVGSRCESDRASGRVSVCFSGRLQNVSKERLTDF